jgi:hypothetical protein
MRTLLSAVSFAFATAMLSAQAVHLVGPGGLPQIRNALAIAAPGDVVLVQPGSYANFHAQVGVTIAALQPGTVQVTIDPAQLGPCNPCWFAGITTIAPPPGQTVHLIGLTFTSTWVVFQGAFVYPSVQVTSGTATFANCSIAATSASFPALRVQNANLHLQHCTIDAYEQLTGIFGLLAISARITAVGTTITRHATIGSLVGTGVFLTDSTLHGSRLVLDGDTTAGLRADNSSVWLVDSIVRGTQNGCPVTHLGVPPQLDRCTLVPAAASCPSFAPAAPLLGVEPAPPPQLGTPYTLTFRTVPNGFAAVFVSSRLDHALLPGVLAQPLWIALAGAQNLGITPADAAGVATASWPIPSAPSLVGETLWFQAVTGLALPLQASPASGGTIR